MKIKWKTDPAPTGPYRSFQHRGWPTGEINGQAAFHIKCVDDYYPAAVRSGAHAELTIAVAQWHSTEDRAARPDLHGFNWRNLSHRAKTLAEAKEIAAKFLAAHPEFFKHMPTKS